MSSGTNVASFTVNVFGNELTPSKCVKMLGLHIDDKLLFLTDIKRLFPCIKSYPCLNRVSKFLNEEVKIKLYNTLCSRIFVLLYSPACLVEQLCLRNGKSPQKGIACGIQWFWLVLYWIVEESKSLCPKWKPMVLKFINAVTNPIQLLYQICFLYLNLNLKWMYNFRCGSQFIQPNANTKTFGLNALRYEVARIWNMIPEHI